MKFILVCSLIMLTQTTMAADSSGNIAIWGAGKKSCFSYSSARKSGDDGNFQNYLMGYLTAYNAQTPDTYRISGKKNLPEILSWLDNYCETKPVHGFDQALIEFITEHYPMRYKRAPGNNSRS